MAFVTGIDIFLIKRLVCLIKILMLKVWIKLDNFIKSDIFNTYFRFFCNQFALGLDIDNQTWLIFCTSRTTLYDGLMTADSLAAFH